MRRGLLIRGLALMLGIGAGLLLPIPIEAQQASVNITQSGNWQVEVECVAQTALTISVDGGAAQALPGIVWAGAGPFTTLVSYPATASARTVGAHQFSITNPGQSVTLADGSTVVYDTGTVTTTVNVFPDPPGNASVPKILRWLLKIGGLL